MINACCKKCQQDEELQVKIKDLMSDQFRVFVQVEFILDERGVSMNKRFKDNTMRNLSFMKSLLESREGEI